MFQPQSNIPGFIQISISVLILVLLALGIYYLIYIGNNHVNGERKIVINWKKIFRLILIVISISIIVSIFKKYPILGSTVSAIFISILFAYLLNPLVNKLESKGIKRTYGTLIVYTIVLLLFVGLGFLVIPSLLNQIKNFITNLPNMTNYALNWIKDLLRSNNIDDTKFYPQIEKAATENIANYTSKVLNWSANLFTSLSTSLGKILTLILIPIITYFFLSDKKMIFEKIKQYYPKQYYSDSRDLFHEIDESMSSFVRGRILMAIFVGIVTMILLLALKVQFAVVIGLITMIGDIIPYIGPFMGFLPAIIFSLMISPAKAFWVGIAFFLIQWVENNILGPKLLGKSTGLHPLVILLSIIIGGGMFGVWGMILSVPFVSLVIILAKFARKKTLQ